MIRRLPLLLWLSACAHPVQVQMTLEDAESTLALSDRDHGRQCDPRAYARSQAHQVFTKIELEEGDILRARAHAQLALSNAQTTLEVARACGRTDTDGDNIPDVIDLCPRDPEDFDGVEDEDGCHDVEPYADQDGDHIRNIDDDCVNEPEDFDGHADEDGCPETSEDSDGDQVIDIHDQCPKYAEDRDGFQDEDGCPDLDNDDDGIPDRRDTCPNVGEDFDGWDDGDGCPDPDNDQDGIADIEDRCPNEVGPRTHEGCPSYDEDEDGISDGNDRCPGKPETPNNYLDQDGCPDTPPTHVRVTRQHIELLTDRIRFEAGSANLLPTSLPILGDIYKVLTDAPQMRIVIAGHTDSEGSDPSNLELSRSRAQAVRDDLIGRGIAAERLQAVGFGETQPVDTNRTERGRQNNRRVEFQILDAR